MCGKLDRTDLSFERKEKAKWEADEAMRRASATAFADVMQKAESDASAIDTEAETIERMAMAVVISAP